MKNKEVFLDFDEYNTIIKSTAWNIFAEITEKSL